MKRYWYLMAIAATLLASCNKDEEETEIQGFKVLEYRPAPGQFINEGFDCQTMRRQTLMQKSASTRNSTSHWDLSADTSPLKCRKK